MQRLKILLHLFRLFLILFLLSVNSLVVAEVNSSIDKLQGRNKSSVTDEIKQQLKTDLKSENKTKERPEAVLGINTADVREDTSSAQFLDLFKSSIPFQETVPWGSSKGIEYDKHGWPTDLKEGQAGTKFLNRLPQGTVEDGFFTVLYDGEGTIFYGNDARLVVHRPNKDIIEIKSGKDKILNASLFIKKSNPDNYIRNIRILPEGGICEGTPHVRVKSDLDCGKSKYLSFEDNHLNPLAEVQRNNLLDDQTAEKLSGAKQTTVIPNTDSVKTVNAAKKEDDSKSINKEVKEIKVEADTTKSEVISKTDEENNTKESKSSANTKPKIKGYSDTGKAIIFNPDYLDFMKDFQVVRFMNMSGMTRNPVEKWENRNTLEKASWGGKYGSRGAPVEVMVALSNEIKADPWFSMPYKASDEYIKTFGKYVSAHLNKDLKAYIEYSNEVWNPIFTHHDYAIAEGMKQKLDKKKSIAGYKWYSLRSVETFKIWEKVFDGSERLVRVLGSWASNQTMSSTILSYKDAFKHTDAVAIGPYFSAHPRVLRRAKTVDDIFKAMLDKTTKWGMVSTVNYIKKQANVAKSFGVDLVAYEGGQHLVDWNTRKVDEHPNKLLYAANRDPRMGILYDELMQEWQRKGGKLFVAFSAPRIYSWYGSWGLKEHIRQPRSEAPKYDSLLRYLNARLYPEKQPDSLAESSMKSLSGEMQDIPVIYAKTPNDIWNLSAPQNIKSTLKDNSQRDISASWQASWDTKHLYISLAVNDDDLQTGDSVTLTLDTTTEDQIKAKKLAQDKIDIETEKKLLVKKKEAQTARRKVYEARAKAQAEKEKDKNKDILTAKKKTESVDKESLDNKVGGKFSDQTEEKVKETAENTETSTKKKNENIAKTDNNKVKIVTKVTEDKSNKIENASISGESTSVQNKNEKIEIKDKKVSNSTENDIATATKKIEKELTESLEKTEVSKTDTTVVIKDKKTGKESVVTSDTKMVETVNDHNDKKEPVDKPATTEQQDTDLKNEKGVVTPIINEVVKVTTKENATSFIFTPFDEASTQARAIKTDAGYLLNLAIPWQQIYSNKELEETSDKEGEQSDAVIEAVQAKPGDKLGINFVISDTDSDEKGGKELRSADTNLPLPKIVLKNSLVY